MFFIVWEGQFWLHVNCFAVNEIGPFRRLTAGVRVCSTAFLFWLLKIPAASFVASWLLPFSYGFVLRCLPNDPLGIKRPSTQTLESLVALPRRRRRAVAHSLHSSSNDSEPAPLSSVPLSGPSSPAIEPAIPVTGPAFLLPCLTSWSSR